MLRCLSTLGARRTRDLLAAALVLACFAASAPRAEAAPGLSPYTRRVMERIAAAQIDGQPSAGWSLQTILEWIRIQMSPIFSEREADVTRSQEALRANLGTSCLQADILLLQAQQEKTRLLLQQARKAQNGKAVSRLSDLYIFIGERVRALAWGANEPGYADPFWTRRYSFDTPQTFAQASNELLCPFSTKYADISLDGRSGCTPTVLGDAAAMLQTQLGPWAGASVEALSIERGQVQDFLTQVQSAWQVGTVGMEHQAEGCGAAWPAGYRTWSTGRFAEIFGARFLRLLLHLWNIELLRPSAFVVIDPLIPTFGLRAADPELARDVQEFSAGQAHADALLRTAGVEARRVQESFGPFTQAVGKLARLSSTIHPYGDLRNDPTRTLRDFVRDAAYFLRRSCVNRPCNASLDRVLRVVTSDACFPYTSGLGDPPEDATPEQKWAFLLQINQRCMQQASPDQSSSVSSGIPSIPIIPVTPP